MAKYIPRPVVPVSEMSLDDALGEIAHLDMYFVRCNEIGQGIGTKEAVKYLQLAARIFELFGDFESEYYGKKISVHFQQQFPHVGKLKAKLV